MIPITLQDYLYQYATAISQYLALEEFLLSSITSKEEIADICRQKQIPLREQDLESLTLLQLCDYIMSQYRIELRNVTHSILFKMEEERESNDE